MKRICVFLILFFGYSNSMDISQNGNYSDSTMKACNVSAEVVEHLNMLYNDNEPVLIMSDKNYIEIFDILQDAESISFTFRMPSNVSIFTGVEYGNDLINAEHSVVGSN